MPARRPSRNQCAERDKRPGYRPLIFDGPAAIFARICFRSWQSYEPEKDLESRILLRQLSTDQ